MYTITLFLAMMGSGQQGDGNSTIGFLIPIIIMFAIMYLLLFRPQAKKQKEMRKMLETLNKGDKILTVGGIFGTIVGIKEKENILIVKIADNVKVEMSRNSIARKITETTTG